VTDLLRYLGLGICALALLAYLWAFVTLLLLAGGE